MKHEIITITRIHFYATRSSILNTNVSVYCTRAAFTMKKQHKQKTQIKTLKKSEKKNRRTYMNMYIKIHRQIVLIRTPYGYYLPHMFLRIQNLHI